MSKYSSLRDELIRTADDSEYRHAYAEESLNISIATQIKVIREQRQLTQGELASEAETKQSVISRYENANYSSWSIRTLRKLAKAFDVDLEVRFRSFAELVESVDHFSRAALQVPKFADDPYFKLEQPAAQPQPNPSLPIDTAIMPPTGRLELGEVAPFITAVGSAVSAANGYPPTRNILMGTRRA